MLALEWQPTGTNGPPVKAEQVTSPQFKPDESCYQQGDEMKELNKVAGGIHKTSVDPANLMKEKDADPLGVYKLQDKGQPAVIGSGASAVMPDADSEAVAAARRRKMAAMKQRGGRASTILGGEDRLGGG